MPGDCCECGACCFSESDSYVPVTEEDRARLGDRADRVTAQIDGAYFLRMADGHCAQLQHLDGDWVCGIYPRRPDACRKLRRGSPECLAERALKRYTALRISRHLQANERGLGSTSV